VGDDDGDGDGRCRSVASYPSSGVVAIAYRIVVFVEVFPPPRVVIMHPDHFSFIYIFSINERNTTHPKTNDRSRSRASRTAIIDDVLEGQKGGSIIDGRRRRSK
jgi:hypothetical protein